MRRERIRVRAPGLVAVVLGARTPTKGPGLAWPERSTAPNYDFLAWFAERYSEYELARQMEALGVLGLSEK